MTGGHVRHDANLSAPALQAPEWVEVGIADARRALRDLFGTFLTGVTVVTMQDRDGAMRGFTANSFTSVSLDPPLILVCVASQASSHDALCAADRFGVNILGDWQRESSNVFASRSEKKFEAVDIWSPSGGPPLLAGSLSAMDCQREQVIAAGDHSIVIGRVIGFHKGLGQPLGYHSGGYVAFGLGSEALERLGGEAIRIGCLLEFNDKILLVRRANAPAWELPAAPLRAGEDHRQLLPRLLAKFGIAADVSSLYSVYQEAGEAHTTMIFRGVASDMPDEQSLSDGTTLRLFAQNEEPWQLVMGNSPSEAIRRFFRERAQSRFGIYWETGDGGRIASLQSAPQPWLRHADIETPIKTEDM
jgi:flavin-dependent trigonelline monooxygenase, reductase component